MSHPGAMIGSDGIPFDAHPHPRLWGTFPRVLGHYSRDLKLFPLEDAVRRMTSYSAQRFHLTERGEVKPGFYADICVFDPATVIDTATFEKPISPARGIDTVLCNGAIAWRDGKPGGGRAGRALNRQADAGRSEGLKLARSASAALVSRGPPQSMSARDAGAFNDQSAPSSRRVRSRRSWRSCASTDSVAIGRASRRFSEIGSPVSSQ